MSNYKKILMYIIIFVLLFQESIQRIIPFKFIDCFDEIFVLVIAITAIIKTIQTKKISLQTIILFILLLAFFATGTLSLLLNSSFEFSKYIVSSFLAIKCFLLIICVSIIGINDSIKKQFITIINNIGIICAVVGIFNFIVPNIYSKIFTFGIVTYRFGFVSVSSLFYHPGRFGWFMLLASILNYVIYKKEKQKKNLFLFIIFGLLSLLSFKTKVILSIVGILIFDVILSSKINVKKIMATGLFVLIIFCVFNKFILNTYNLYFSNNNTTISARQSLTENSFKIMDEYFPLGVGFGKYGSWYARQYYSEYYYKYNMTQVYGLSPTDAFFATDTFWASIIGETGLIGTVLYITFLIYIIIYLKKYINKGSINNTVYIHLGLLVMIQSIIESFGEQSFNSPPQYIFLGIIVGIAINESTKVKELGCEKK